MFLSESTVVSELFRDIIKCSKNSLVTKESLKISRPVNDLTEISIGISENDGSFFSIQIGQLLSLLLNLANIHAYTVKRMWGLRKPIWVCINA